MRDFSEELKFLEGCVCEIILDRCYEGEGMVTYKMKVYQTCSVCKQDELFIRSDCNINYLLNPNLHRITQSC